MSAMRAPRRPVYDHTTAEGQKRMMAESMGLPFRGGAIECAAPGDYGTDPAGNGMVRMVPSGDIVTPAEASRRLRR